MLNLNLTHSTTNLDASGFQKRIEKIKNTPVPKFAEYEPDLSKLKELREKYKDKKNIIVEGNGGAISNFRGIWSALGEVSGKNVVLLDTEDPDYIYELRKKYDKKNTLVILTSKSGTRIQVLANYFAFQDYPMLIITEDNDGALNQIRKIKNIDVSFYPAVNMTDRYTGLTESALTTAEIVGINTEELVAGGKEMYKKCNRGFHSSRLGTAEPRMQDLHKRFHSPDGTMEPSLIKSDFKNNPALRLAIALAKLEKAGYTEIFLSIYSKKLSGFAELIIQLYHESVCKNGIGQLIYGSEAPENQHHTLQRLISGRKNSVGFFITTKNPSYKENALPRRSLSSEDCGEKADKAAFLATVPRRRLWRGDELNSVLEVPDNLKNIKCRNIVLGNLNNISLAEVFSAEFQGTWQDVVDNKIPAINLELNEISPYAIGEFMAFFYYTTFYSALLRGVNPCDQPGVEKSKENIFEIVGRIGR